MTDVVHGEIVSPAQYRPLRPLAARANVARSDVATVARFTHRAVTHDTTRAVCREIAYIPGGVGAAARWWRASAGLVCESGCEGSG